MEQRRGRIITKEERIQIIKWVEEAIENGASQYSACKLLEIDPRTLQRWKKNNSYEDMRSTKKGVSHNILSKEEERRVLEVINLKEYENLPPSKIVPLLADKGEYIASESTIYRLLKREGQLKHRHKSKPRNPYKPKAIVATKPNQVYSWDITYLSSRVKGMFFYLYLIMDIYSRKIVGWQVYDKEGGEYAADLLEDTCKKEQINKGQVLLHSDNGSPMKGAIMLATMQKLGVVSSFSRPGVSNDNPYSESLFRTMKYMSKYPESPFDSLEEARNWTSEFVDWYNKEHLHSGIKFVTPSQRHEGIDEELLKKRKEVYKKAKQKNPERWSGEIRDWEKIQEVRLNPEKCKSEKIS